MSNVGVAVRVRPLTRREKGQGAEIVVRVDDHRQNVLLVTNPKTKMPLSCMNRKHKAVQRVEPEAGDPLKSSVRQFCFDYSYNTVASQEKIHEDVGSKVLDAAFEGYNACVLAYGQSGSGKTFTMMGQKGDLGLIPRICKGLFSRLQDTVADKSKRQLTFRTEVSFLEIYNEKVSDLLRASTSSVNPFRQRKPGLRVREHPKLGPCVQDLSKHLVTDFVNVRTLIERGIQHRRVAATRMHDRSSRSHAVFTINFTQASLIDEDMPSEVISRIHLVDLAGSEKATLGMNKMRLKEGANINKSLVALGSVIYTLADRSPSMSVISSEKSQSNLSSSPVFVPYRDSVLTWLLKESLGGNSKTILIATVSPANTAYNETINTLRYAQRAKCIVNKPVVNENPNMKLIRELKAEVTKLRRLLYDTCQNNIVKLILNSSTRRRMTTMDNINNGCRSLATNAMVTDGVQLYTNLKIENWPHMISSRPGQSSKSMSDDALLLLLGSTTTTTLWRRDGFPRFLVLEVALSHRGRCLLPSVIPFRIRIAHQSHSTIEAGNDDDNNQEEKRMIVRLSLTSADDRQQVLSTGSTSCIVDPVDADSNKAPININSYSFIVESCRGRRLMNQRVKNTCYQLGFISSSSSSSSSSEDEYVTLKRGDVDVSSRNCRSFLMRSSSSDDEDNDQSIQRRRRRIKRRVCATIRSHRPSQIIRRVHQNAASNSSYLMQPSSPPPLCTPMPPLLMDESPSLAAAAHDELKSSVSVNNLMTSSSSSSVELRDRLHSCDSLTMVYMGPEWGSTETNIELAPSHPSTTQQTSTSMDDDSIEESHQLTKVKKAHADCSVEYVSIHEQIKSADRDQVEQLARCTFSDSGFRTGFDSCTDDHHHMTHDDPRSSRGPTTCCSFCQTSVVLNDITSQTDPIRCAIGTQTNPLPVDVGTQTYPSTGELPARRRPSEYNFGDDGDAYSTCGQTSITRANKQVQKAAIIDQVSKETKRRWSTSTPGSCDQCSVFKRQLFSQLRHGHMHSDYESENEENYRKLPSSTLHRHNYINQVNHDRMTRRRRLIPPDDATHVQPSMDNTSSCTRNHQLPVLTVEVLSLLRECRAVRKTAWLQISRPQLHASAASKYSTFPPLNSL